MSQGAAAALIQASPSPSTTTVAPPAVAVEREEKERERERERVVVVVVVYSLFFYLTVVLSVLRDETKAKAPFAIAGLKKPVLITVAIAMFTTALANATRSTNAPTHVIPRAMVFVRQHGLRSSSPSPLPAGRPRPRPLRSLASTSLASYS